MGTYNTFTYEVKIDSQDRHYLLITFDRDISISGGKIYRDFHLAERLRTGYLGVEGVDKELIQELRQLMAEYGLNLLDKSHLKNITIEDVDGDLYVKTLFFVKELR